MSVLSELQSWGNGGWRPAFFTHDTPHLCTGWKQIVPQWFHEFIKNTGRDDCPVPPGTYEVNAYNISFAEFNVPMWEYGKYKLINQVYKENVLVGCIGMVLESTPTRRRPSKKKH
nr:uncharacterized protein LOC106690092 [Halyomorpha halys]